MSKTTSIVLVGVGGQGILLATQITARAAIINGHDVKTNEVHGMAQRGGSVESHIRFGARIFSPLIQPSQADYIVCFHEGEGRRLADYLKKDGLSFLRFINDARFQPADKRFFNTYYLGILSAYLPMPEEAWRAALTKQLKRALAENEQAFGDGRKAGFMALGKQEK